MIYIVDTVPLSTRLLHAVLLLIPLYHVCVVFTLNRPFYPTTSVHPVPVLIPYSREILIMCSQTVRHVPGKAHTVLVYAISVDHHSSSSSSSKGACSYQGHHTHQLINHRRVSARDDSSERSTITQQVVGRCVVDAVCTMASLTVWPSRSTTYHPRLVECFFKGFSWAMTPSFFKVSRVGSDRPFESKSHGSGRVR